MRGARYWTGPADRHYAYSVDASYDCPVGKLATFAPEDEPPAAIAAAAATLGMDPHRLGVMLRKSSCGARYRDDDGRLTDRCDCHRAKMTKRGYRAFIDEPIPDDELDSTRRSSKAISQRLGFSGEQRRVVEQRWCDTKREARDWAWSRCKAATELTTA